MAPQLKTYSNRNTSLSKSVDVVNALFAKNLYERNKKKNRRKNYEIKELPKPDSLHELLNDSELLVVRKQDSFDDLFLGNDGNKRKYVVFDDNKSSNAPCNVPKILIDSFVHSPIIKSCRKKGDLSQSVNESLEVEYEKKNPVNPIINTINYTYDDFTVSHIRDDCKLNSSTLNISMAPTATLASSTPLVNFSKRRKLVDFHVSAIAKQLNCKDVSVLEESLQQIDEWEQKPPTCFRISKINRSLYIRAERLQDSFVHRKLNPIDFSLHKSVSLENFESFAADAITRTKFNFTDSEDSENSDSDNLPLVIMKTRFQTKRESHKTGRIIKRKPKKKVTKKNVISFLSNNNKSHYNLRLKEQKDLYKNSDISDDSFALTTNASLNDFENFVEKLTTSPELSSCNPIIICDSVDESIIDKRKNISINSPSRRLRSGKPIKEYSRRRYTRKLVPKLKNEIKNELSESLQDESISLINSFSIDNSANSTESLQKSMAISRDKSNDVICSQISETIPVSDLDETDASKRNVPKDSSENRNFSSFNETETSIEDSKLTKSKFETSLPTINENNASGNIILFDESLIDHDYTKNGYNSNINTIEESTETNIKNEKDFSREMFFTERRRYKTALKDSAEEQKINCDKLQSSIKTENDISQELFFTDRRKHRTVSNNSDIQNDTEQSVNLAETHVIIETTPLTTISEDVILINDSISKEFIPIQQRTRLLPGKMWRRSLRNFKRLSMEQHEPVKLNEEKTCTLSNPKQLQELSVLRKSVKIVPQPLLRDSSRKSVIEAYAEQSYAPLSTHPLDKIFEGLSVSENLNESLLPIVQLDQCLTARDIVLRRCGLTEPAPFSECYPPGILKNCHKIGEGVYGEVFLFRNKTGSTSVMKVIPIEGDLMVNGERQKKFEEILTEIIIAQELSELRNNKKNFTDGFSEVREIKCVQGKYPDRLLDLWDLYDDDKGSENDRPDIFDDQQLYIVLELANGGRDLESFVFNNASQTYALFRQMVCSLAVAESALEFEHRDLHWGNVLISTIDKSTTFTYYLNGREILVPSTGVQLSIIDFTLSRIKADGVCIFNDLSQDPDLFNAEGDYQFEVYRLMQKCNNNEWQQYKPFTNILWLHYTLEKMITAVRYKYPWTKTHFTFLGKLIDIKEQIRDYNSVEEFLSHLMMK